MNNEYEIRFTVPGGRADLQDATIHLYAKTEDAVLAVLRYIHPSAQVHSINGKAV